MATTIESARYTAMLACPYYRTALLRMPCRESTEVPFMGVSKQGVCYYNPSAVAGLPKKQAAGVLIHELEHLICRHWQRVGSRYPLPWNLATDATINERLKHYKLELPSGCVYCSSIPGSNPSMIAEEIYDLIKIKKIDITLVSGGSASDGQARPWESLSDSGLSEVEQQAVISAVKEMAEQQASQRPGSVPGGLLRELGVSVCGESRVERFLRELHGWESGISGRDNPTWKRFPRRQLTGFIQPGRKATKPRLVICLDTSGSMDSDDLEADLRVVQQTLGMFGEVNVIAGDTQPEFCKKVFRIDEVKLIGGGGTDMSALIQAASKWTRTLLSWLLLTGIQAGQVSQSGTRLRRS